MNLRHAATRTTKLLLTLLGSVALVTGLMVLHAPKASADVKAVETFECDPDTDTVVFSSGPISLAGSSCTGAIQTLDNAHFDFNKARGPETINREHLVGGTDTGPGHSYYLMIFWQD